MATRHGPKPGALTRDEIELLLTGSVAPRDEVPEAEAFDIFDRTDEDLVRLWHENEAELRAEAARRGLPFIWIERDIEEEIAREIVAARYRTPEGGDR